MANKPAKLIKIIQLSQSFQFKHFECFHGRSSMKIGVDAVLLGAWANVTGSRILDVGTGCGVIALMCAQRNADALIDAVDLDPDSILEATSNFARSPWSGRLKASLEDYLHISHDKYDLIISNPPYFNSGISEPDCARLRARHQASLSPSSLISHGIRLLSPRGRIALIVPADRENELIDVATRYGLITIRVCRVQGHPQAPVKRVMLEFCKDSEIREGPASGCCGGNSYGMSEESLILEVESGVPTEAYRALCRDFYLKF